MKIMLEMPVSTALALQNLIKSAEEKDPKTLALVKRLDDLGVDVRQIKISK
jgi:hypothetical protein